MPAAVQKIRRKRKERERRKSRRSVLCLCSQFPSLMTCTLTCQRYIISPTSRHGLRDRYVCCCARCLPLALTTFCFLIDADKHGVFTLAAAAASADRLRRPSAMPTLHRFVGTAQITDARLSASSIHVSFICLEESPYMLIRLMDLKLHQVCVCHRIARSGSVLLPHSFISSGNRIC